MNYSDIKTFNERCETHPDHQNGMVTERDIQRRLHEEIDELRAYILHDAIIFTDGGEWVGLTDEELHDLQIEHIDDPWANFKAIEAKLKDKNT